tara:strand:- start:108 stop:650 length:543 start_codon:yes stop_codon:yes gene_type:complete
MNSLVKRIRMGRQKGDLRRRLKFYKKSNKEYVEISSIYEKNKKTMRSNTRFMIAGFVFAVVMTGYNLYEAIDHSYEIARQSDRYKEIITEREHEVEKFDNLIDRHTSESKLITKQMAEFDALLERTEPWVKMLEAKIKQKKFNDDDLENELYQTREMQIKLREKVIEMLKPLIKEGLIEV